MRGTAQTTRLNYNLRLAESSRKFAAFEPLGILDEPITDSNMRRTPMRTRGHDV
jgi:hypothetical protein